MTFQAPLNTPLNMSNTLDYVTRAYAALGADRVNAIALGNEVQKYFRDSADDYVKAAKKMMANITEALNLSGDSQKIFEVVDSFSNAVETHKSWVA